MHSSLSRFDRFCRQYIDWANQHHHSPVSGVDAFIGCYSDQSLRRIVRRLQMPDHANVREILRMMLVEFIQQRGIAMRFPVIYLFPVTGVGTFRYSLMLVTHDGHVEWTARVWCGSQYQGIITGRGRCRNTQHPIQLARLAVEGELVAHTPHYS